MTHRLARALGASLLLSGMLTLVVALACHVAGIFEKTLAATFCSGVSKTGKV